MQPHSAAHVVFDVEKWLHSTNLKVLLGNKCCKTMVSVRRPPIQHVRDGKGVFASRKFGAKGVTGSNYMLLEYRDV